MGGHGGLNILPHKSWNVYNRKNRLKVKRDEEQAAQQDREDREAQRKRDWDYRRERLLSSRTAASASPSGAQEQVQNHHNKHQHINPAVNPNQERKKHKEDLVEQFQFAYRCREKEPWYLKDRTLASEQDEKVSEGNLPARLRKEREEVERHNRQKKKRGKDMLASGVIIGDDALKVKKKVKKKMNNKKSIEELRLERLERERKERHKSNSLLRRQVQKSGDLQVGKRFHSSYGYARK